MTDITGNFSVGNSHGYNNEDLRAAKPVQAAETCPECDEIKPDKIDLGKDPAALANQALVRPSKVREIGSNSGEYKFDPEAVKADVLFLDSMIDTVSGMKKMYMDKGLSEEAATKKAFEFAEALISGEQQN